MVATSDAVARVRYVSLLTTAAMVAFAANSVLCRAALGGGEIDAASFSAIRLLSGALAARHEALLLDPVYTGKAMAGLIAHVRSGRIAAGPAPAHGCRATGSGAVRAAAPASSRTHSRNARTSARCRAASVVIRQQRSGASAWR